MNPFADPTPSHPGIDHLSAKYARLDFTNGSVNISPSGNPGGWPVMALQTAAVVSGGVLSIPAGTGGNRTTRIFGNAVIDELMRLDTLPSAERYKCKFFATRIKRYLNTTDNTTNERIFQYGDQGSDGNAQRDGGWVMRINNGSFDADGSISAAIHMDYLDTDKIGAQGDAQHADPIAVSPAYNNATWEAALSIAFGVDCTVPGSITSHLFVGGALAASSTRAITKWPVPGKSTNGPGNAASSNGMVLFNQSIDQYNTPTGAHLCHADVWPIWIGEARDQAHLAAIAAALHADPFTNPYRRT